MPALYDHPATPVSSPHGRVLITPPPRSCQAARMVNFPPMRKNIRGEAMRARILAELRRRRDTWGPEPTQRELADLLGTQQTVVLHHLRILRGLGLVHPDGMVITESGHTAEDRPLTF